MKLFSVNKNLKNVLLNVLCKKRKTKNKIQSDKYIYIPINIHINFFIPPKNFT